ncbi:MAG: M3 family metallopeptidase [Verrucomicrobia bacterium]|nr:M3 family metallopeptidase [Verrucomicrobiota bacterium]MCH8510082.1 M3 family metallopeptidase [Kiritimatiellia bacterium]
MNDNPLFDLQFHHHPLPFSRVRPEHIVPALEKALAEARDQIQAIESNPEPPTFANTILALEAADEWADRISSVFFHLLNVDGGPELQALSREIPPMLAKFGNDVSLNPVLSNRVETLHRQRQELHLAPEQRTALENHHLHFARNGALLPPDDQKTLREIDQRLSVCAPNFAENVLKATQAYAIWVDDERVVEPLPAGARSTARKAAENENRGGEWKFTLDMPSFIAFMTYAPDAELRKRMYLAYQTRCVEGEFENLRLIREILELRDRRAKLLGYENHATYVLERRMARDLETLNAFYDRLIPVVMPAARKDLEEIRVHKESLTGESELHPWDFAFYAEKLKKAKYDLDQEALRPFFEYESTLNAVFALCRKLFHLHFEPTDALPVYREDVKTYRVEDQRDKRLIGHLYLDPFPRPTKRPGAWMNNLLGQGLWNGGVQRPDVVIVANFTPPSDGPALLTFDEARTLFHEFGHALHELLSECTCRSVAGTHVFWDFVELPSQLMENWLTEPEFLREFALHHETGEAIPEAFIERIQASQSFLKGYQGARQLNFGLLDLAWHTTPPADLGSDLIAFEREATRDFQLFPPHPGTAMSPSFQHIFSGGYSAGYYSYKWAEVLEADVFSVFKENGLFDPATAESLRENILSKGGSRPPMDLFTAFRGREPDPDALLRRDGLLPVQ